MSALPAEKNAVEVLADYFEYLFRYSREFIESSLPTGTGLWASLRDGIGFVLLHPNRWEGLQQSQMRRAAVLAKLIGDRVRPYLVRHGGRGKSSFRHFTWSSFGVRRGKL